MDQGFKQFTSRSEGQDEAQRTEIRMQSRQAHKVAVRAIGVLMLKKTENLLVGGDSLVLSGSLSPAVGLAGLSPTIGPAAHPNAAQQI